MKVNDETYLAVGVVGAAALLLALIIIGPGGYSAALGSLDEESTTTLKGRGPELTTTTSTEPATTLAPTTTSSTTSTAPSTTSTAPPTSTTTSSTLPERCRTDMDCGGTVSTLKCSGTTNTVYNHTSYFSCVRGAEGGTHCEERRKITPLLACEEWEDCRGGFCLPTYGNRCGYECYQLGYDGHYCRDGACREGDSNVTMDEPCSKYGVNCCCKADGG